MKYFYCKFEIGCATGTMYTIHKGSNGFETVSSTSILGANMIDLKHAIPFEMTHLPKEIMVWVT